VVWTLQKTVKYRVQTTTSLARFVLSLATKVIRLKERTHFNVRLMAGIMDRQTAKVCFFDCFEFYIIFEPKILTLRR